MATSLKRGCFHEMTKLFAVVALYYFGLTGLVSLSREVAAWSTLALAPFGLFLANATTSRMLGSPEQRALARAERLTPLRDGELTAVYGKVSCAVDPLRSPFRLVPCCVYEYRVDKPDVDGEGNKCWSGQFRGFAHVPTAIESNHGDIALMGFGFGSLSHLETDGVPAKEALQPAGRLVKVTAFSPEPLSGAGSLRDALSEITQTSAQAAAARIDYKHHDAELGTDRLFSETVLSAGEEVTAVGVYSSEKRALLNSGTGVLQLWPTDIPTTRRTLRGEAGGAWLMALAMVSFSHGVFAALLAGGAFE